MKKFKITLDEPTIEAARDSEYIEGGKEFTVPYDDLFMALYEDGNEDVRKKLFKDIMKEMVENVDDDSFKFLASMLSSYKKNMEFDDSRDSKIIDLCVQTLKLYSGYY